MALVFATSDVTNVTQSTRAFRIGVFVGVLCPMQGSGKGPYRVTLCFSRSQWIRRMKSGISQLI